ncbi:general stress protein [Saccharibacillus sp. CPCC 101409]|uniref:general stress protein n=1 Tax=Saccharibacillus sp. CPCC 101409 TaxID=3058041 RepID=UPI002672F786|nr:general stress protein [Saccharibacillus sp. CPCC 101409]MDO3412285.1 general stress protein [Saccharibacillus sp. CPCC 101409]
MIKKIAGTFEREEQAVQAIHELKNAGYTGDEISVIAKDTKESEELRSETGTKAPEGMAGGAIAGGALGGAAGVIASLGALAIPGIGPLLAAGPIAAGLAGATLGAGVGGLAGGLIGLGIPEKEAKYYNDRVHAGEVLVLVDEQEAMRSKIYEIYLRNGATNTEYFDPDDATGTPDMMPADQSAAPAAARSAELPDTPENSGDPVRNREEAIDPSSTTDPTRQSSNLIIGRDDRPYKGND